MNDPAPLAVPDHELLNLIGKGSYGEVWLARNIMNVRRAVKVVRRESFSDAAPYEREFAAIHSYEPVSRQVDGLVNVLHVGQNTEAGYFYYVMELADAETEQPYVPLTLRSLLRTKGALPPAEVAQIGLSLAGALVALHRAGLVHRDIKPANIIFVHGAAKLADIGLVGAQTEAATYIGTHGYIAPEGAGNSQADVFALGIVLYEMATGYEPADFPKLPPGFGLRGPVAGELLDVIIRACESDKVRRYPAAEPMLADFAAIVSGQSIRKTRRLERNILALKVASILAGGAALVGVTAWWQARGRNDREVGLRRAQEDALYDANYSRACHILDSADAAQRDEALSALLAADRLRPGKACIRDEIITTLAMPGIRDVARWPFEKNHRPAWNRAGTIAATLDRNNAARVWRFADGATLHSTPQLIPRPSALGPLSPDGSKLCIWWGSLGKMSVYDFTRNDWLPDVPAPVAAPDLAWSADISADGRFLAIGSHGSQLHILTLDGSAPVRTFLAELRPDQIAFSADGEEITIVSRATKFRARHRVSTGELIEKLPIPGYAVALATSPDNRNYAINVGEEIYWQPRTSDIAAKPLLKGRAWVAGIPSFDPTGRWLATSAYDFVTHIFSLSDNREIAKLPGLASALSFTPDGALLRAALPDGELIRSEFTASGVAWQTLLPSASASLAAVNALAFSADGRALFAQQPSSLTVLDVANGRSFPCGANAPTYHIYAKADGSEILATGVASSRIPLLTADTNTLHIGARAEIADLEKRDILAVTPDFSTMLGASGASTVVIRDRRIAATLLPVASHSATMPADASWFAAAVRDDVITVWNRDAKTIGTIRGDSPWKTVAASPDGKFLLRGDAATGLHCHDPATLAELWHRPRTRPSGKDVAAVFTTDSRIIAATLAPDAVWLLDARDGHVLTRLQHPIREPFTALAFSPDGTHLATGGSFGQITVWDLRALRIGAAAYGLDYDKSPLPPAPAIAPALECHLLK